MEQSLRKFYRQDDVCMKEVCGYTFSIMHQSVSMSFSYFVLCFTFFGWVGGVVGCSSIVSENKWIKHAYICTLSQFVILLPGTIEDYKLLEKMNKVTICKYSEMKHIALSIGGALQELNEKCENSVSLFMYRQQYYL